MNSDPARRRALVGALMFCAGFAVCAQEFPAKPIHIITEEPGGGTDFAARLIAQGLAASAGLQVIVDNRGGASGIIATQAVTKAAPDGYTLLLNGSPVWLLPLLQERVPYDPLRDLSPVILITRSPNLLAVHPSMPAKSVSELIALAKAKPGALNYGSAATGGSPHLAAELFKALAGVDIVRVPYKGSAAALNDVIGGRVQLMFPTAATVMPHLKSDRLRILAVTTAQPSLLVPGLPTIAETLPGYESAAVNGVFAPAGTPPALVNRLYQEIARAVNRADVKEKFFNSGVEAVDVAPERFAALIRAEMVRMGKVIRDAGIRGE